MLFYKNQTKKSSKSFVMYHISFDWLELPGETRDENVEIPVAVTTVEVGGEENGNAEEDIAGHFCQTNIRFDRYICWNQDNRGKGEGLFCPHGVRVLEGKYIEDTVFPCWVNA